MMSRRRVKKAKEPIVLTKSEQEQWDKFVLFAAAQNYRNYIGNLSFASSKSGDIMKLVESKKVMVIQRNGAEEAEYTDIEDNEVKS
tara:strand:+ start:900 stop:1157 length:258 start_codon:yes stop_codon:yes gene_type:complete